MKPRLLKALRLPFRSVRVSRRSLTLSCLGSLAVMIAALTPDGFVDGVTAASAPAPQNVRPILEISSDSHPIEKNRINFTDGQSAIVINVCAIEPNNHPNKLEIRRSRLPSGARWEEQEPDIQRCGKRSGAQNFGVWYQFTWSPSAADVAEHQNAAITFTARNNYYRPATERTQSITIHIDDTSAPEFDAALPSHIDVIAGRTFELPIIVRSENDSDAVRIVAQDELPEFARLGKARPGKSDTEWLSQFAWKPSKTQLDQDFKVSFVASNDVGNTETPAAQASHDITFTVVAPRLSSTDVKSVSIQQASWAADRLSVSGKVSFKKPPLVVQDVSIGLYANTTAGPILMEGISVNEQGLWSAVVALDTASIPCQIQAQAAVAGAPVQKPSPPRKVRRTPRGVSCS